MQFKYYFGCSTPQINTGDSLILTELVMENVLTDMEPAAIASILSAFVFQEKTEVQLDDMVKRMTPDIRLAVDKTFEHATRIAVSRRSLRQSIHHEQISNTFDFTLCRKCNASLDWMYLSRISFSPTSTLACWKLLRNGQRALSSKI